jgi:hypothetical protein
MWWIPYWFSVTKLEHQICQLQIIIITKLIKLSQVELNRALYFSASKHNLNFGSSRDVEIML